MVTRSTSDPRTPKRPARLVLAPGARVLIRDEEWVVRVVRPTSTGAVAVHVTGLSELVRNKDGIFLSDIDPIVELRPEDTQLELDKSPRHRSARLYLESLLRRTPPTDARIHVGHRAAMEVAPYQLEPAHQALAQPRPRILIADGVGIGKTVETGILLSELIRRGRGERILVVTLKSILAQFQRELWARFTIPLVRLDSVGIQRLQAKLPSNMNPFYYFNRVIISIDTLKSEAKYQRFLEATHWDVVVIDECQHVAVRTRAGSTAVAQRARLAELLARSSDALILTSATPHDGKPESFASLMNLLEPTAVANPADFTKEEIQGLYIRRFKRDIVGEASSAFRERAVRLDRITASPTEDAALAAIAAAKFKTIDREGQSGGILFRTLLLKSLLSSPAACLATLEQRKKNLDATLAALEKGKKKRLAADDVAHDLEMLEGLRSAVARVTKKDQTKLARLLARLGELGWAKKKTGARVVIFSERIPTLETLRDVLEEALALKKGELALFDGSLDDQRQKELVQSFGVESSALRILLASDVASEGINLHYHCHHLIHFDIPWSLITLEQRNGRIDRYGQRETPEIRYLLTVPEHAALRGDLRVLEVLVEKEQQAHKNLGDVASLMHLYEPEKEEARVAEIIERHQDPDHLVAPAGAPEPDGLDMLALILGHSEGEPASALQAETAAMPSLFSDDLAYAREAFEALAAAGELDPPEWHEHLQGLTVVVPEDLSRRLEYLPPELRPDDLRLKLTQDRKRVMDALAETRKDEDRWPEWQLLWDLHPVAEWLNDRVLAHFRRHAAPVIEVEDLGGHDAVFLFLGVLSNQRSQPVIVEWFGVGHKEDRAPKIEKLEALLDRAGLKKPIPNRAGRRALGALEAARGAAVEAARTHMTSLRRERSEKLHPALKQDLNRLKAWRARALEEVEKQRRERLERGRKLSSVEEKRLEERTAHIQGLYEQRHRWVNESLRTVERPYLRIAAVLTTRE